MEYVTQGMTNDCGQTPSSSRTNAQPPYSGQPLTSLSLNQDISRRRNSVIHVQSDDLDLRILDDDPDYDEDAEPDNTPALTKGLFTSNTYIFKQIANILVLHCSPRAIYPLRSANIPRAWIPYLQAAPPHPDEKRILRDYYPLPHQQTQFDEWEASHPPEVLPGMHTFNLCTVPSYWDDEIPPVPLPYLIISAISGSPSAILTEREIKLSLIRRFPYFAQRLARNSRWQISANWILNRYACFERVPRDATSEDDGCAYRAWGIPSFQTLIYPEECDPEQVPIHVFFPIDYGESISDLSLKPTRPARQPRRVASSKLSIKSLLNPRQGVSLEAKEKENIIPSTMMSMDPHAHASGSAHSKPDSLSLLLSEEMDMDFADYTELSHVSEDECLIWSPAPTLTTFCSDDMNIPIPAIDDWVGMETDMDMGLGWTEEFTLGFGLNAQQRQDAEHVVHSSGPSTWYRDGDVVRLKDVWPGGVPPPWDQKWPSLWVQCMLAQSVKLGSDENAKAALRKRILKKAATDFGIIVDS